jgi:hypothetical protein
MGVVNNSNNNNNNNHMEVELPLEDERFCEGQNSEQASTSHNGNFTLARNDINGFPQDVWIEIFSYLSLKENANRQSVSKAWRGLLRDPHLLSSHLEQLLPNRPKQYNRDAFDFVCFMNTPSLAVIATVADIRDIYSEDVLKMSFMDSKGTVDSRRYRIYLDREGITFESPPNKPTTATLEHICAPFDRLEMPSQDLFQYEAWSEETGLVYVVESKKEKKPEISFGKIRFHRPHRIDSYAPNSPAKRVVHIRTTSSEYSGNPFVGKVNEDLIIEVKDGDIAQPFLIPREKASRGICQARAANNDGSILFVTEVVDLLRSFIWSKTKGKVSISKEFPDFRGAYLNSCNNDGSRLLFDDPCGNLFRPEDECYIMDGNKKLFKDALKEAGISLEGWSNMWPSSISDNGRIIVGSGDYHGESVLWRAVLPKEAA